MTDGEHSPNNDSEKGPFQGYTVETHVLYFLVSVKGLFLELKNNDRYPGAHVQKLYRFPELVRTVQMHWLLLISGRAQTLHLYLL
jgi:hypothetical protein